MARLLQLFALGMAQPLPLYCKTSAAYAAARVHGADDADVAGRQKWESTFDYDLEDKDRATRIVLGDVLTFNEMVTRSGALGDDELSLGCDPGEHTRFGFYARVLWDGLLEHETVRNR